MPACSAPSAIACICLVVSPNRCAVVARSSIGAAAALNRLASNAIPPAATAIGVRTAAPILKAGPMPLISRTNPVIDLSIRPSSRSIPLAAVRNSESMRSVERRIMLSVSVLNLLKDPAYWPMRLTNRVVEAPRLTDSGPRVVAISDPPFHLIGVSEGPGIGSIPRP